MYTTLNTENTTTWMNAEKLGMSSVRMSALRLHHFQFGCQKIVGT